MNMQVHRNIKAPFNPVHRKTFRYELMYKHQKPIQMVLFIQKKKSISTSVIKTIIHPTGDAISLIS